VSIGVHSWLEIFVSECSVIVFLQIAAGLLKCGHESNQYC
jgi:hypothetical protein